VSGLSRTSVVVRLSAYAAIRQATGEL